MLIGIDIGQSAVKVTALDHDGRVRGMAAEEIPTAHPAMGWAEQNPQDWIAATGSACRRVLAELEAGGNRSQAVGVGLTGATHHAVLLDEQGRPVRPCIMLTDGRSAAIARDLMRAHGPLILERARNTASAGWSLPQLRWVAEQEPEVWARTARLAFAKDVIREALTGQWATDRIEAEGSLLFNPVLPGWDPELARLVPLPIAWLPPALDPTALTGEITRTGAQLTGLPEGTPVIAGCSDTAAEAYAAGACTAGDAVVKLATAGNVNLMTAHPSPRPEWFTYSHPIAGLSYHAIGTNSAASSQRWFRDVLRGDGRDVTYAELDEAASRVPAGAGGVLFHPYLLGERAPHWDPDLRASFIGLSAAHGRGHLLRAILEGVAFSLADCLAVFKVHNLAVDTARIIGGGARSAVWRQIVADVLGVPLHLPSLSDASAGAALLAGVGMGVYSSPREAVARTVRVVAEHTPDRYRHAFYAELLEIYREAQRKLAPIDRALVRLQARASDVNRDVG